MKSNQDHDVLERNVTAMLEAGGEAPRIADTARARIRTQLVAKHGTEQVSRRRSPLIAIGLGLAATAAGAFIVTRSSKSTPGATDTADGATWVTDEGARVTQLGPRRLRVEGAALVDVAPGKGAFYVETARGTIEVVGTRFLVDAAADRTTAAVVRGSVKLASSDGSVLLHAGEQGVVEAGRPPTRGPAPRLSHLVSWAEQARRKDEHAIAPVRNGTLFAHDPNNPWVPESPLPIAKLGVDIVVEDQVARVAIDQTFHNPQPRVLEGMYRFAIPPDASLQRLAMYVDGRLTESAVVERMRARRIYEDVVNRRLDPALLEWAGTGRLALKVYPLPAQEDKRLLIAYTQSLPKLYDDWSLTVPLPEVDLPVGELDFDVRVKGCANCEITSTGHKIHVDRTGDDAIVSYKQLGAKLGDSLVLHVRDKRAQTVSAQFEDPDGKFVLLRARPELQRGPREYHRRTWVVLDDVSASRDAMARRAQNDLIDGFLRELDEDDRIAIVAFDVAARTKLPPTRVLDVDRKAVRAALAAEGGVGATDFAAALDAATKLFVDSGVAPDDAMIIYLGDGVITSGPRQLDALRGKLVGKAHFVGVGVGDGPDTQTLESLAAATAGYATTIDLADDVGWHAFDLVAALHTSRVTGVDARLVDASGALVPATVYVKTPQLADGEELELVAKLAGTGTPTAVELTGSLDGKPWSQRVALDASAHTGGYLPRLWAERHIAARLLAKHEPVQAPACVDDPKAKKPPVCKTEAEAREERDEGIRKEIVALGKKYFLLSRHTSLLVLENDEMYKKYDVQKGTGETWAPYVVPAKIPVVHAPLAPDIALDTELVRRPLQIFYAPGYYDGVSLHSARRGLEESEGYMAQRGDLGLATGANAGPMPTMPATAVTETKSDDWSRQRPQGEAQADLKAKSPTFDANADNDERELAKAEKAAVDAPADKAGESRKEVFADELGYYHAGGGKISAFNGNKRGKGYGWISNIGYPARLGYPTDQAYDDLTGFMPGMLADASDAWRRELEASAGGATTHAIDDSARALLEAARRALPAGLYRWGELQIAVDSAHRFGWRRTTGADLTETASYDGQAFTRRYAELGVDVTRKVDTDDVALALAYLPVWIAEPAHYARYFEVRSKSPREVQLLRTAGKGKTELAYVLVFDDAHHLVAVRDARGDDVVAITWRSGAPVQAKTGGDTVVVGYSGMPTADAIAWAHAGAAPGVVIDLPMHLPAYWAAKLDKLDAGTAEWRHAQRQRLASLAATQNRSELFSTYETLRKSGGVEVGDLALASLGVTTAAPDAQLAAALEPLKASPVAQYIRASRAYTKAQKPEALKATTTTGFIGALWTVREATALYAAEKDTLAVDRILSLGQRAFDLRLVGAAASTNRYRMKPADITRVWDSVALGDYKNLARAQAAIVLGNHGNYDAAAERLAQLVATLDLDAQPANLAQVQYLVQNSRRGQAGWQLMWATWRDRVLAGNSYDHVMALMQVAGQHPIDMPAVLARAAALAGNDPDRVVYIARVAMQNGHHALANSLIEPLLQQHPTRELHALVANIALGQGRHADALAHLEAAQKLDPDEAVALSTVRAELAQIITVARQLAVESTGNARKQAVQRALDWGAKWRVIDPGNPQIDSLLGDLLLAVGDTTEAWRQLSSVIERDPMSGDGYQTVAAAFEAQGRVAEAVDFWHQAVILDQTNPTPRMRQAQALIALGKTAEGDAMLNEIVNRKWHVRWDGVVYQVKSMIERGKGRTTGWDE